jgi:hypothetical protein
MIGIEIITIGMAMIFTTTGTMTGATIAEKIEQDINT